MSPDPPTNPEPVTPLESTKPSAESPVSPWADFDREAFEEARRNAVQRLLDERSDDGWWLGELSTSALSTATAITALAMVDRIPNPKTSPSDHADLIDGGIVWLCQHQNEDGGWGDTDRSFSNISTTTLVWAAFMAAGVHEADHCQPVMRRCEAWLDRYIKAWEAGEPWKPGSPPSSKASETPVTPVTPITPDASDAPESRPSQSDAIESAEQKPGSARGAQHPQRDDTEDGDAPVIARIEGDRVKRGAQLRRGTTDGDVEGDSDDDMLAEQALPEPVIIDRDLLARAIIARYGKDRTFSVPILTMCVLAGRMGDATDRKTWRHVIQLPFEFAAVPQGLFNKVNMRVVSYALPALIAIGQVKHCYRPTRNPVARAARNAARKKTLKLLRKVQPTTGGYLEATPLTSFVTMSLAAMCGAIGDADNKRHAPLRNNATVQAVINDAVRFLEGSVRSEENRGQTWDTGGNELQGEDGQPQEAGGWPIDTNLATWVTTLSVNALAAGGNLHEYLSEEERATLRDWLLNQQYTEVHPYTNAAPGGWAWTDLAGGVPDADDTSGALLALYHLGDGWSQRIVDSAEAGLDWLNDLRNRNGGIPTFCRGWGRLPFDMSSNDITAHALRAESAWQIRMIKVVKGHKFLDREELAMDYLEAQQGADGAWLPLWFGNQHRADEANPVYGTSRVTMALACTLNGIQSQALGRAVTALRSMQKEDGGFGETPSIEETALAVEALAGVACIRSGSRGVIYPAAADAAARGIHWLIENTWTGTWFEPAPIGFYFAKLWYYEKLYPIIFTVAAMERVATLLDRDTPTDGNSTNDG